MDLISIYREDTSFSDSSCSCFEYQSKSNINLALFRHLAKKMKKRLTMTTSCQPLYPNDFSTFSKGVRTVVRGWESLPLQCGVNISDITLALPGPKIKEAAVASPQKKTFKSSKRKKLQK